MPAKIPSINLGMAFFAYGTSRKRTLRVPASDSGIVLSRCHRQPYRLTEVAAKRFLVIEVSLSCEVHRDAGLFGSSNDFFISDATSRLHDSLNTSGDQYF